MVGIRACLFILSLAGLFCLITMHFWGLLLYTIMFGLFMRHFPNIGQRYRNTIFNLLLTLVVLVFVTLMWLLYSTFEAEIKYGYIQDYFELVRQNVVFNAAFLNIDFGIHHWMYYSGLLAFYLVSIVPLFVGSVNIFSGTAFDIEEDAEPSEFQEVFSPISGVTTYLAGIAVFALPWFFIHSDLVFDPEGYRSGQAAWALWGLLTIWFFGLSNAIAGIGSENRAG